MTRTVINRTHFIFCLLFSACFLLTSATEGLAGLTIKLSPKAQEIVDQAHRECTSFDNGILEVAPGAVTHVDFSGDGRFDEVIDSSKFACSTAASLFCGTGGCSLSLVSQGRTADLLAKDWKIVVWDQQPILLLVVHGSECGGNNLRRCYRAMVWTDQGISTVGAP